MTGREDGLRLSRGAWVCKRVSRARQGGPAAVALDVELEDGGVVDQEINGGD
jgi:hypothetical protein